MVEYKGNLRTLRPSSLCHDTHTDSRARSGYPILTAVSIFSTSLPPTQQSFNAVNMLVPAFLFLASYAITSTDATQNATHDDLVYGWVSTDCGRGTSDILFTIFLCVWTVSHHPVPHYQGEGSHSFRTKIVRSKIVTAIIVLIAPEVLVYTAVRDFQNAMRRKEELRKLECDDFSLTHGFFFDMGCFCLKSPKPRYHQLQVQDIKDRAAKPHSKEWIRELSNISEGRIKDSATSDNIAKSLACLQAVWLATQVVSRSAHHQAVTLLEVSTMAYVLCALISYGFWWVKPQNCVIPIIIACSKEVMKEMSASMYEDRKGTKWEFICSGRYWMYEKELIEIWKFALLFVLAPSAFGAVHLAFLDMAYPTDVELWLWRVSTVACLVIPILFAFVVYLQDIVILNHRLSVACMHILLLAYLLVRKYMLVDDFLSLRALPSSVFDTVKWSSFIPHI